VSQRASFNMLLWAHLILEIVDSSDSMQAKGAWPLTSLSIPLKAEHAPMPTGHER
jgi:hypothetical protein